MCPRRFGEVPTGKGNCDSGGKSYPLVAAVSETLPMSVLLGRDLPVLVDLLQGTGASAEVLVMTRAQKRQHQQDEVESDTRTPLSGVEAIPVQLDETGRERVQPFGTEFNEELFSEGRQRSRLTRRERREHNARVTQQKSQANPLDLSAEELKELLRADDSLEVVRQAANGQPSTVAGTGFLERDGLL